jgi:hypothetical protein
MNTIDLNDPNWRPYSPDTTKALHIFPNQLWHNSVGNLGALVIFKPQAHEEFPVNQAGLQYVLKAHQEKRIVGYVVFARRQNWELQVVAMKDVAVVAATLKGVPPRTDGQWGPYWWMRTDFTPDSKAALGPDERPF